MKPEGYLSPEDVNLVDQYSDWLNGSYGVDFPTYAQLTGQEFVEWQWRLMENCTYDEWHELFMPEIPND